ncbi:1,2-diacylglycerol 3-glucosyltransferase [Floricoccus tropicus]|uniref:1,2-diacylglycerol 3-glucosyltransferase n=1 Tax=Floricoccus tropicus TaxID=1859473 RepID=A0A1E8GMQ1_9LACT|nr:glycosyltransferase family 4 protein [Floricoccus tropicus]OFI48923.1 1,2-diacylglycerol 3-glucosyltransferase [Floricoccus tropicus]
MKIGIFSDTYFPQVSGVATSIRTLKEQLEEMGNEVYLFTTTDPHSTDADDPTIIRLPSVPFISFTDRRVVMRGLFSTYNIAKKYGIEIVHIQTEFGVGFLGKFVASQLEIPIVHTLHTKYEDYVHYIAKGHLIHPGMIKYMMRMFLHNLNYIICPSQMVYDTVNSYGVKIPKRIISTGIDVTKYDRPDITDEMIYDLRSKLGISDDEKMLLSLSRISSEKNIQEVISAMPEIVKSVPAKLVIVGDGPYRQNLEELVDDLSLKDYVQFTGMIDAEETPIYYRAADFSISASVSETQGLTYTESIASGTPIIATDNPYLESVVSAPAFGHLYKSDEKLSDAVIIAVNDTPKMTKDLLDDKLYKISSEYFGKQVYQLYIDTIISYDYNDGRNSKEESFSELVLKTPISMAKEVAKAPKQLSKMAKKAGKSLKIYGDEENDDIDSSEL